MENIKEFLKLIDEYQSRINKEIKDDKKAEKVWTLMSDLAKELEEIAYPIAEIHEPLTTHLVRGFLLYKIFLTILVRVPLALNYGAWTIDHDWLN